MAPRRSFSVDLATPYLPFIGKENPEDCNDLGPDGFKDLLLLFDYRELRDSLASAQTGDVEVLRLTGQHIVVYPVANDGQWRFVGEDVVVIQRDQ